MRFYLYVFLVLFSGLVLAQEKLFRYKDWEIICDNTLTCRAVGHNKSQVENEDDSTDVSILLTRKAGINQSFLGYVKISYEEPSATPLNLSINDQSLGSLQWNESEHYYSLSERQTEEIIQALKGNNNIITFDTGDKKRILSDAGFNAIMLKMDEKQGRVGTTSAVIKAGDNNESEVYPEIKPPTINKAPVFSPEQSQNITIEELIELFPEIKQRYKDEDNLEPYVLNLKCDVFEELTDEEFEYNIFKDEFPPPRLIKLNDNYSLLEVLCVFNPRENNFAYWLIPNEIKPMDSNIKLITKMGARYQDGVITAEPCIDQGKDGKGCVPVASWVWDGKQFSLESIINFSKGQYLTGGKWLLPVFVSEVKSN